MVTYLVYHIDKGLGIVSGKMLDHLNLIIVQEDCCDQGNALFCGEGTADQPFPGWILAGHEKQSR